MCFLRIRPHTLHAVSLAGCLVLFGVSAMGQQGTPAPPAKTKPTDSTTNGQVVRMIASNDEKRAAGAVDEVMKRGPAMIPLLLRNKGDRRPFRGWGLGNSQSAQSIPLPTGNAKFDEGKVITVEVASLYLISALYYETLEFAQSPYLTDLSLPSIKRKAFNSRKLVAKAWAATEAWVSILESEDMKSLRSKQHTPLKGSQVDFW